MAITPVPTPRQTIAYGDRPFVDSRGHLTLAAYQFLQRLGDAGKAATTNVAAALGTSRAGASHRRQRHGAKHQGDRLHATAVQLRA